MPYRDPYQDTNCRSRDTCDNALLDEDSNFRSVETLTILRWIGVIRWDKVAVSRRFAIVTRQPLARESVRARAVLNFQGLVLVPVNVVAADERAGAWTLCADLGARAGLLSSTWSSHRMGCPTLCLLLPFNDMFVDGWGTWCEHSSSEFRPA